MSLITFGTCDASCRRLQPSSVFKDEIPRLGRLPVASGPKPSASRWDSRIHAGTPASAGPSGDERGLFDRAPSEGTVPLTLPTKAVAPAPEGAFAPDSARPAPEPRLVKTAVLPGLQRLPPDRDPHGPSPYSSPGPTGASWFTTGDALPPARPESTPFSERSVACRLLQRDTTRGAKPARSRPPIPPPASGSDGPKPAPAEHPAPRSLALRTKLPPKRRARAPCGHQRS